MEIKMCVELEARASRKPHMCSSLRLRVLGDGMRSQSPGAVWMRSSSSGSSALTWLSVL